VRTSREERRRRDIAALPTVRIPQGRDSVRTTGSFLFLFLKAHAQHCLGQLNPSAAIILASGGDDDLFQPDRAVPRAFTSLPGPPAQDDLTYPNSAGHAADKGHGASGSRRGACG
jgi:hypothetical protein